MDVTSLIVIVVVTALTTAAIVGLVVSRAMKNQGGLSAQDACGDFQRGCRARIAHNI